MTAYNRNTLVGGLLVAVLVGGVLSYFKSESPDGLEKTQQILDEQKTGGAANGQDASRPGEPAAAATETQSLFADYKLTLVRNRFLANAAGGILGSLAVMGLLLGVGYLLRRARLAREKARSS
jgi:hypothetical protein